MLVKGDNIICVSNQHPNVAQNKNLHTETPQIKSFMSAITSSAMVFKLYGISNCQKCKSVGGDNQSKISILYSVLF